MQGTEISSEHLGGDISQSALMEAEKADPSLASLWEGALTDLRMCLWY